MSYIAMMPLRKNVPNPTHSDWQPAYCPICGREDQLLLDAIATCEGWGMNCNFTRMPKLLGDS